MVEILDAMPQFAGPYVFTSTAGQKPVNGWARAKDRIDKASGVTGWRFHDLRRTTRTRISAIPAEEHVREALIAHGRRGIAAPLAYRFSKDRRPIGGNSRASSRVGLNAYTRTWTPAIIPL